MNLMTDEKILMEGDYKQIVLTTHRIRQENTSWGKKEIVSIMLEHVSSCEYNRKSNPVHFILGVLFIGFGVLIAQNHDAQFFGAGSFILGIILIFNYLLTSKRALFISSPSAKVILNTKGMQDENIQLFIDKLETAKNDRLLNLKMK